MRGKRAKQYRKLMHRYCTTFGFREPYQVLVDERFLEDAASQKIDVTAALYRTVQGKAKPMITQCSIRHLYRAKPPNQELIAQAKGFERRRCNHHTLEEPLTSLECILSVIDPRNSSTNKHRYVVASQDILLRSRMRRIVGVPLIYISRSVVILEPMTATTGNVVEVGERAKFRAGLRPKKASTKLTGEDVEHQSGTNNEDKLTEDGVLQTPRGNRLANKGKRRGPKGPNPLSMKKPKSRNAIASAC